MSHHPMPARRTQRGVTLFGLMFWAIFIGFSGYVLVRTVPTVNEYFTIQSIVTRIAAKPPASVGEVRVAFDKQVQVERGVEAIKGKDLVITKVNDRVVIAFAYDKVVPLFGPVNLLLKYEGRSQ